ncbi:hypothetical protein CcaCcLH18_05270 [Colletotrichum camelliae]|nr:hypothetical protein CcaCcLH18_05270 [Colletotrichum camelliae]
MGDSPRGENTGHWIPHPKARATQATASCPNGVPLYVPSFATRLAGGYFTLPGASSSLLVLPLPSSSLLVLPLPSSSSSSSSSLLIFFFLPRHLLPSSSSFAAAFLRNLPEKTGILTATTTDDRNNDRNNDKDNDKDENDEGRDDEYHRLDHPFRQSGYARAIAEAIQRFEREQMCAPSALENYRHWLEGETERWRDIFEDVEAEYAVKGLQSRNEDTMAAFDDPNAIKSAALVSDKYFHFRLKYVTYLQAEYNELRSSNLSLSQQVVDLTTSLQTSYDYGRTLGKDYAKLLEENDKLRKSNFRMSALQKRALDTNETGSTDASNLTTSSTNQTMGERIAALEANSKSSTDSPQWKTVSTDVFLVVGWIASANGFMVVLLDNWWPRLIWFLASFLSLFNRCRNTKAFQDRIKKKWPTKATLASEVQSHLANHVALKTTLHTLDNAFNALISPANPTGWRPNGRLSTLEVDLAALQARHEESKRDFHRFIRAVAKFAREYKAHTARGGDFRKLRATVMQLSRKFVVFVGRSGRVTRLEGEVASLKERLEALENASPSQHPPASTPSSSQPQIPSSG